MLIQGFGFATAAAALNASVGIFSKILLAYGWNAQDIAFIKTLSAALLLTVLFAYRPFAKQQVALYAVPVLGRARIGLHIALCAFLGIFTLFYFETVAYQYGNAANVVVVLMASAAVSALVLGRILLGEQIVLSAVLGTAAAVVGITLVSWTGGGNGGRGLWCVFGAGKKILFKRRFALNPCCDVGRSGIFADSVCAAYAGHHLECRHRCRIIGLGAAAYGAGVLLHHQSPECLKRGASAGQRVVRTVICCFIGVAAVGGITARRILGGSRVYCFGYCFNERTV